MLTLTCLYCGVKAGELALLPAEDLRNNGSCKDGQFIGGSVAAGLAQ